MAEAGYESSDSASGCDRYATLAGSVSRDAMTTAPWNVVILAQRLSAEAKAGQILLSPARPPPSRLHAETTAAATSPSKASRDRACFAAGSVNPATPARP